MKKLLAMLTSISTIGTIMPTILANAPTKTENNNLQANNLERNKIETLSANDYLETLNRNKRDNNFKSENNIYWVSPNGNARADNDVPYPVTTMYTFTKNEYGRNIGDTYFGTTNGVYLRKNNELGTGMATLFRTLFM